MNQEITIAIDKAQPRGGVTLWKGSELIAAVRKTERDTEQKELLEEIDGLLRSSGYSIPDVGTLVCSRGPGGYTGIRVGLATARGLGRATGAKVLAYSFFEALVAGVDRDDGWIGLCDAGRNEYFVAYDGTAPTDFELFTPEKLKVMILSRKIRHLYAASTKSVMTGALGAGTCSVHDAFEVVMSGLVRLAGAGPGKGSDLTPVYGREFRTPGSDRGE